MNVATGVALLAPVPEVLLVDALDVCAREGKVAFGSRDFELFRKLDDLRAGQPAQVLLYASQAAGRFKAETSWRAIYVGHVESKNGAHPAGMKFRPPFTANSPSDNLGHWAIFWEITSLERVPPGQGHRLRDLRGLGKRSYYKPDFIPERPYLVEEP